MTTTTKTTDEDDSLRPFYMIAMGVCLIVATCGALLMFTIGDWTHRGQFGDMFGVLNTTFSGLAFAALVYTLILQRKELRLQRLELAMTRTELQKQASAQTEHAKTAIRAARIAALGSLYQSYSTLLANGRAGAIGGNWEKEMQQIQKDLRELLRDAA